jgi:hypothetical protein
MPKFLVLNQARLKLLALATLLLSNLPFPILALFCHPAFDDYDFTSRAMTLGFFRWEKVIYTTVTGRYFSMFLLYFNPLKFGGIVGFKTATFLTVPILFVAAFAFINAFLQSTVTLADKLILSAFFVGLFSNQMPEITEMYYVMTSRISYLLPSILTLVFFALVLTASKKTKRIRLALQILAGVLIFAIVGASEISMLVLALLIFSVTINLWLDKQKESWIWLVFSIVTMACSAIVILAPGNTVRSAMFDSGQHRFIYSVGMSVRQELSFLIIWCSNLSFLFSTLLFIPLAANLSDRIAFFKHVRFHPLVCSLLLLLLVFFGFFPAYWSMGMMGQFRTVNTVYFFFLIGWFLNIAIWIDYLKRKRNFEFAQLPNYVYVISVPIILAALLFTNNTRPAFGDLARGRAYRYDKAVYQRSVELRQCIRADIFVKNCPMVSISDLPTTITKPYYETEFDMERYYWRIIEWRANPTLNPKLRRESLSGPQVLP